MQMRHRIISLLLILQLPLASFAGVAASCAESAGVEPPAVAAPGHAHHGDAAGSQAEMDTALELDCDCCDDCPAVCAVSGLVFGAGPAGEFAFARDMFTVDAMTSEVSRSPPAIKPLLRPPILVR